MQDPGPQGVVRLLPFSDHDECAVSAGRRIFLGCVDGFRRGQLLTRHNLPPRHPWTPRHIPEPLERWDPVAACVYQDCLLILQVKRRNLHKDLGRVVRQQLGRGETVGFDIQVHLGDWKETPAKDDHLNTAVKLDVMPSEATEGQIVMIVSHRNGKVELFISA